MTLGSAENSTKAAPGRPFRKGQSGNPGGRPKGLATLVAKHTNGGAELVEFWANVFHQAGEFEGGRIPLSQRAEAATWLADRLWGKPKQVQEVTGADGGAVNVEFSLTDARELLASRVAELAPAVRARLLPAPVDADEAEGAAA